MKFLKRVLNNGMTVVMEKRDLPIISASITNRFGAAYEESKIKGIAHFIEHLVFTGTKTRTHEDISREIEKKGGVLNAFTSHEVTSFWFKLPSEHIFTGFDIISDIINNPIFDEKKFEKEKKVIIEEIKMYHDNPARYVFEMAEENLYEKPFGEGVIGSEKTIKAMSRDFVANFYDKNYSPENYIVALVGNGDFEKICAYLEKTFKKKGSVAKKLKIEKKNGKKIEERDGIDQAHYVFAFHGPKIYSKEHYALEVLDAYLANGMSSKLFLKIREEKGLAYAVKSSLTAEKDYSYYGIYVGTRKEALEEVEKIIVEELKNVDKMTEKDLKEAKERVVGLRRLAVENSDSVMNELLFAELAGSAEKFYEYEGMIEKVSLEEVKKMAKVKEYSSAAIVPK